MTKSKDIVFGGQATAATEAFAKITGRRTVPEVVSDSMKSMSWILEKQSQGRVIVSLSREDFDALSRNKHFRSAEPLSNYIVDQGAAQSYFEEHSLSHK